MVVTSGIPPAAVKHSETIDKLVDQNLRNRCPKFHKCHGISEIKYAMPFFKKNPRTNIMHANTMTALNKVLDGSIAVAPYEKYVIANPTDMARNAENIPLAKRPNMLMSIH